MDSRFIVYIIIIVICHVFSVIIFLIAVGIYNGSQAKEYCMEIKDTHINDKMFTNKTKRRYWSFLAFLCDHVLIT